MKKCDMYYIPRYSNSVKFVFSKKATKIDKIFIDDLTLATKFQIDGVDFVNFCGLLRRHELYPRVLFDKPFYHH